MFPFSTLFVKGKVMSATWILFLMAVISSSAQEEDNDNGLPAPPPPPAETCYAARVVWAPLLAKKATDQSEAQAVYAAGSLDVAIHEILGRRAITRGDADVLDCPTAHEILRLDSTVETIQHLKVVHATVEKVAGYLQAMELASPGIGAEKALTSLRKLDSQYDAIVADYEAVLGPEGTHRPSFCVDKFRSLMGEVLAMSEDHVPDWDGLQGAVDELRLRCGESEEDLANVEEKKREL